MMDTNHLGGGGWMLAWKCTRGSTFHYDTNYWTSTNTYNETSQLNRNDGDHKNHVFNYFVAGTLGAVFPDINNGGQSSVGYNGWTWKQGGVGQTCLQRFQNNEQISIKIRPKLKRKSLENPPNINQKSIKIVPKSVLKAV